MALVLELANGRHAGLSKVIGPGVICRVGADDSLASQRFEFPVVDDANWAGADFALTGIDPQRVLVTALGSVPIEVDGVSTLLTEASHRSWIVAGGTAFRLWDARMPLTGQPETVQDRAVAALRDERNLYLLLDTALDRDIQAQCRQGGFRARPVYDGAMAGVATGAEPWIVALESDEAALSLLLRRTWGKRTPVYFQSAYSLDSIRKWFQERPIHPAHRFFDGRWLSAQMRTERGSVLFGGGPCSRFWIESRDGGGFDRWMGPSPQPASLRFRAPRQVMLPSQAEIGEFLSKQPATDPMDRMSQALGHFGCAAGSRRVVEELLTEAQAAMLLSESARVLFAIVRMSGPDSATAERGRWLVERLSSVETGAADRFLNLLVVAGNRSRRGPYAAT